MFRSLVVGAERVDAGYGTETGDVRITPVGKWRRTVSLDGLLQLWRMPVDVKCSLDSKVGRK